MNKKQDVDIFLMINVFVCYMRAIEIFAKKLAFICIKLAKCIHSKGDFGIKV